MELESNKTVWRYGAIVIGVKNRCRKPDRHVTDKNELGPDHIGEPNEEKARELAINWAKKNFKSVQKITATATLWTILDNQSERWEPFEKSHNLKWPVDYEN